VVRDLLALTVEASAVLDCQLWRHSYHIPRISLEAHKPPNEAFNLLVDWIVDHMPMSRNDAYV
jgi:hypothetical protein